MDGVLNIDKPAGITSHDVVDQVRRILHERRVGHTGTLDPFATGVMVVLIGRATRLAQFLSGAEKEYEAVIRLGYATDTGDATGKRISGEDLSDRERWTGAQVEAAMASLRGRIEQVPPMYSAKKQAGRKLYELARAGQEVEREPVNVTVYKFELLKPQGLLLKDNLDGTLDLGVRVACSAGTYVRTLAEDFGKRLGVGAHVAELRRTRVGEIVVENASSLEQLKIAVAEESLRRVLAPPDEALSRFPVVDLDAEDLRRIKHGLDVKVREEPGKFWTDGERVRMRNERGDLVAVAIFILAAGTLHPSVVITQETP